jgi:hypothetical protein
MLIVFIIILNSGSISPFCTSLLVQDFILDNRSQNGYEYFYLSSVIQMCMSLCDLIVFSYLPLIYYLSILFFVSFHWFMMMTST